ncbi:MAG: hypothetical protein HC897_05935, partial [Thermoanaerobaculia bacterium]|nr:hypothetical protein [Thermoanaerobaculia bacterium]
MKPMLHHTRAWAWQAILLMVCLTVSALATNRCSRPGWELRTTVRGLGGEPLREYSTRGTNGWQWVRDYVYRNGGMLAAAEPDGNGGQNVYHFHPDHLGTPRQITNISGVQVALHSYYPFGQEATDPAQTSFTKIHR